MANVLFDTLLGKAAQSGERVFLETPGGAKQTYDELLAATGRVANALVGTGVKPGDRVAAQVDKSREAIELYLGAVRAGAAFLPLNTAYTPTEVAYFLNDAKPAMFACQPKLEGTLEPVARDAGASVVTLGGDGSGSWPETVAGQRPEFSTVARTADDLAAILYTSGTTGRSKGAMLSHRNLESNARTLADYWAFTADDVLLHALPIFHTHGLFVATNTVLVAGASMLFLAKFDVDEIVRLMPRATAMMGVPTFYTRLLDHPGFGADVARHMRLFVAGSAPLLAETHRAFKARTGHDILERYGMTETCMNTSNPYDGERRAGTVGFPLPGVALRVTDPESGKELATGEVGVLEVKGPNVFTGYWGMPEKTAAEFRDDGFFITGDLGRIDEDGYVSIVGRGKDLIISGGFNVYPKEIEQEIDAIPGVRESAVIGLPHADFGEGVTAVVVPSRERELSEQEIIAGLGERLARYKQPKRVLFVDELPRNAMGKVQKNVLRERYADLFRS